MRYGNSRATTGIDSPLEPPASPDLRIDTVSLGPAEAEQAVIRLLMRSDALPAAGLVGGYACSQQRSAVSVPSLPVTSLAASEPQFRFFLLKLSRTAGGAEEQSSG